MDPAIPFMSQGCKLTTFEHDSYCSAPPLVLPPRPSRAQEARRPRAPIWLGKREASASEAETEIAIDDSDACDVKPDIKPDSPIIRIAACVIRPVTASAASSPEAQRVPLPSYRARMGTPTVRTMQSHAEPCRAAEVPAAVPAAVPMVPVAPAAAPANLPRRPGRPPGSKSKQRVSTIVSSSPPPIRREAKASAEKTRDNLSRR